MWIKPCKIVTRRLDSKTRYNGDKAEYFLFCWGICSFCVLSTVHSLFWCLCLCREEDLDGGMGRGLVVWVGNWRAGVCKQRCYDVFGYDQHNKHNDCGLWIHPFGMFALLSIVWWCWLHFGAQACMYVCLHICACLCVRERECGCAPHVCMHVCMYVAYMCMCVLMCMHYMVWMRLCWKNREMVCMWVCSNVCCYVLMQGGRVRSWGQEGMNVVQVCVWGGMWFIKASDELENDVQAVWDLLFFMIFVVLHQLRWSKVIRLWKPNFRSFAYLFCFFVCLKVLDRTKMEVMDLPLVITNVIPFITYFHEQRWYWFRGM